MATLEMRGDRMLIAPEMWLEVLTREYLHDYLQSGGSAVKVISGNTVTLTQTVADVRAQAEAERYFYAALDPGEPDTHGKRPDLHRIDKFYFAATANVDWKGWAAAQARNYLDEKQLRVAPNRALDDLDGIAADNGLDPQELLRQYQREFAASLTREYSMATEFRNAVAELGRAQLIPNAVTPTTEEVLLAWLAGQTLPGGSAALKSVQIYERINQTNARHILASFCHWLPKAGYSGLVAVLDMRPYEPKKVGKAQRQNEQMKRVQEAIARGASQEELLTLTQPDDSEPALFYSDAAYLQMLTLIRHFIDEIDRFAHFLLVILTTPQFYDGESRRKYTDYDALQTRIGLEVHDARRANPAAALVHLAKTQAESASENGSHAR